MIKYILNSGGLKNNPSKAKEFFTEVVKGLGTAPKILICCFAQPREDWEEKFAQDRRSIKKLVPEGVSPVLELAFPSKFEEQIKNSDAIYLRGGDDHLIKYWLQKFKIPEMFEGKVVATNSASSHVLSKYFWTCDWREPMEGLRILPIKFLAHYKSSYGGNDPRGPVDWEKAYNELKEYKDTSLPVHALKEGDYIVFEK